MGRMKRVRKSPEEPRKTELEIVLMPTCPHCGQAIEAPEAPKVPWWKLDLREHGVNLGCGSLILIAIIVAVCSGGGGLSGRIDGRIDRLDSDIQKLENRIGDLAKAIDKLNNKP
jgi:hypothetical protein